MKSIHRDELVRCKYWVVCSNHDCDHFEIHQAGDSCIALQPIKYCRKMKGFVHDVHISQIDSNYECDPNLAFKAMRDTERRKEKDYKKIMSRHRGGDRSPWDEDDAWNNDHDYSSSRYKEWKIQKEEEEMEGEEEIGRWKRRNR